LVAGDIDQLTPLVEEKTHIATRLSQFAEQRNQMLAAAALPATRNGMETWLSRLASSDPARKAWNSLVTLTAEAQALNESNGKLIAMRMQHNQQALNVLLAAANQASLYGPDGQTKPSGGGRLFGSA
jgi:flagella synthesis protein FlgN